MTDMFNKGLASLLLGCCAVQETSRLTPWWKSASTPEWFLKGPGGAN